MRHPLEKLDAELGDLVRIHRISAGISQVELGEAAGISYQQIQKYESGANKISVSRLFAVAGALGLKPSALLAELEGRLGGTSGPETSTSLDTLQFLATRRGQQMVRAMADCDDPRLLDVFTDLFLSTCAPRSVDAEDDTSPVNAAE